MLRLRKILLYNHLYYFILVITLLSVFIRVSLINYKSIYSINTTNINGILTSHEIDGNKLSFIIKNKEKIICNYYFKNLQEKKYYLNNLKLGINLELEGEMTKPINNTIPNTFNYKKYLYSKRIYFIFKVTSINKIKDNNINLYYKVKNILNKRFSSYKKTEGYLKAFVIGDTSLIKGKVSKSFQINGISHLLAISGSHITLLSLVLLFILNKIKIKGDKKYYLIIIILFIYTLLTGIPPSIFRAFIFFFLLSLNKIFYTNITTINIYIITVSILLLFNPFYIYDLGFLYSIMTSLGLILYSDKLNSKNYIKDLFLLSLISLIFSFPITAYNFYEINLLSIVNNIIFVPFISVIVTPLSLLTFIFRPLEFILYPLIKIFEYLSVYMSKIDCFIINIPKLSIYIYLIYYLLIIFIKKIKIHICLQMILIILSNIIYRIDINNYVYFLDVGQGDSTIIRSKYNKEIIMIDTGGKLEYNGSSWQKKDNIYNLSDNTITFLKSIGITRINLLLLTHGDYDHMGDAINLINNFKVEKVIFNNGDYNNLESELIKVLEEKNIPYYQNVKELNIDDNKLYFLNDKLYNNENDNSNVIYTEFNDYKFLFMGDAGIKVEDDLLKKYNLSNIDILKIGHHGSKTSSSEDFIVSINPKYSVISVGKNNRYGHPNNEVLKNLEESTIYRTDLDGSIIFKIKNSKLKIETYTP